MIGSVKRGSAHGVLTGLGFDRNDVARFVAMYDRDAAVRWDGDVAVIKSLKLVGDVRAAFVAALSIIKPRLVAKFEVP